MEHNKTYKILYGAKTIINDEVNVTAFLIFNPMWKIGDKNFGYRSPKEPPYYEIYNLVAYKCAYMECKDKKHSLTSLLCYFTMQVKMGTVTE